MKPRTHKRLLKVWPLCCGLAIGVFFAVASGSVAVAALVMVALFGALAWGASRFLTTSEFFGPWKTANTHHDRGEWSLSEDEEWLRPNDEDPFDDDHYPTTDWLNGVSRNRNV